MLRHKFGSAANLAKSCLNIFWGFLCFFSTGFLTKKKVCLFLFPQFIFWDLKFLFEIPPPRKPQNQQAANPTPPSINPPLVNKKIRGSSLCLWRCGRRCLCGHAPNVPWNISWKVWKLMVQKSQGQPPFGWFFNPINNGISTTSLVVVWDFVNQQYEKFWKNNPWRTFYINEHFEAYEHILESMKTLVNGKPSMNEDVFSYWTWGISNVILVFRGCKSRFTL